MPFEIDFIKWIQSFSTGFLDFLGEAITILAEEYVIMAILAFIYFVYNKRLGEMMAFSIFTSLCVNNSLKGIIKAPRPATVDASIRVLREHTATGFSFPSGHTQAGTVLYTSLGIGFKAKKLWILIGIIIFLIALSRVYLGVHFPKDVVASIVLGIGIAFLCAFLYTKVEHNLNKKMMLYIIITIVFLPFLFVFYRKDFSAIEAFRDFYTGYALYIGFVAAIYIENRFVNFDCTKALRLRLLRFVVALILFFVVQFGLKFIFPNENIFFDFIRYFLVSFIGLGLYPLIFKKLKWF